MPDDLKPKGESELDKKTDPAAKKAQKNSNTKWYIIGGLAVIAVLVFFFVSKSKSAAASPSASTAGYGTTSANNLLASLLPYMMGKTGGSSFGMTGPAGPPGATGATGPAGPPASTPTPNPTPSTKGLTAVSNEIASTFLSNKNVYNPSGQKSQNPYYINGQWYLGPLEEQEYKTYESKHKSKLWPGKSRNGVS
jgi:hypothetical protein